MGTFTLFYLCCYDNMLPVFVGQTEELEAMAQESSHLRDEVDILRHTAEKVVCIYIDQVLT